jgi:spore coat protein JA
MNSFSNIKAYYPYVSPFDPCDPIRVKTYITPPNLYLPIQPPGLPQNDPFTALKTGTLWPIYYSPYEGRLEGKQVETR